MPCVSSTSHALPQCRRSHNRPLPDLRQPCPGLAVACLGPAEPWSSLSVSTVHCHSQPEPCCPYRLSDYRHTWYVPGVVPASGPRLDSALQRWRSRPQLQSLRSLRGLGDIRPGWDPGPLPRCLINDAGGPGPPSGPRHQARRSPHHLGLSHHLPQQ